MSVEQLIDKSSGAGGGREDGVLQNANCTVHSVYFELYCVYSALAGLDNPIMEKL